MPSLTERFKALPIDTIERLEKTIDLVFEKVINIKYIYIYFHLLGRLLYNCLITRVQIYMHF